MVGKDGLERAVVILDKTRAPSLFDWLKAATVLVIRCLSDRHEDL